MSADWQPRQRKLYNRNTEKTNKQTKRKKKFDMPPDQDDLCLEDSFLPVGECFITQRWPLNFYGLHSMEFRSWELNMCGQVLKWIKKKKFSVGNGLWEWKVWSILNFSLND